MFCEQFGEDGFEKAVRQFDQIEDTLGLGDIAQFTVQLPLALEGSEMSVVDQELDKGEVNSQGISRRFHLTVCCPE